MTKKSENLADVTEFISHADFAHGNNFMGVEQFKLNVLLEYSFV